MSAGSKQARSPEATEAPLVIGKCWSCINSKVHCVSMYDPTGLCAQCSKGRLECIWQVTPARGRAVPHANAATLSCVPLSLPSDPLLQLDGLATNILLGGNASQARVGESMAMLFWHKVSVHACSAVEAAITHLKFTNQMYLQLLGFVLVPALDWPFKRVKVIKAEEEHVDVKEKGKACADTMDKDEVIEVDELDFKEWDGLAQLSWTFLNTICFA